MNNAIRLMAMTTELSEKTIFKAENYKMTSRLFQNTRWWKSVDDFQLEMIPTN